MIRDTVEKIKNEEVEISRITTLIDKNENLKVIAVGDDDQNIYSFRNSDSKYMQSLITRAKQNLSIHTNSHYVDCAAHGLTQIQTDSHSYPAPQRLCYLLTHTDLWLNVFVSPHCQAAINNLKSGMPLRLKANGCADLHGNEVLCFSQKFKNTLEELGKKGYRLKEASVNFIVYWKRQDDKLEVKIVLPKIIVEKE